MNEMINVQEDTSEETSIWSIEVVDTDEAVEDGEEVAFVLRSSTSCTSC
ncbi:hypothetical protein BXY39_0445 [Eilatimonas milleporae]|uniref:Uncharacterized protein n=1 Tax=Eilatimonas milleporae TaxID=911205 RepID=A0A3M0CSP0_9PROT|nr:hypothetical protein BXY39_0445 [Eilatimonas milleporae]